MRLGARLSPSPRSSRSWAARVVLWQTAKLGSVRLHSRWSARTGYRARRQEGVVQELQRDPTVYERLFPVLKAAAPVHRPRPGILAVVPPLHPAQKSASSIARDARSSAPLSAKPARHVTPQESADYPVVVHVPRASPSLLESDFFRHAPRGQHIEGWARGLRRIVQARDPVTLDPLGQYYLVFDGRSEAAAFIDEVARMQVLVRDRMGGYMWKSTDPAPVMAPSLEMTTMGKAFGEDSAERLAAYTLLPPSMRMTISVLDRNIGFAKVNELEQVVANATGMQSNQGDMSSDQPSDGAMGQHDQPYKQWTKKTATDSYRVMLSLHGKRMDPEAMRQAIDDDGRKRGLPWQLWGGGQNIVPVGLKSSFVPSAQKAASQGSPAGTRTEDCSGGNGHGDVAPANQQTEPLVLHSRFIVYFTESAEAHRFVRNWHKRSIFLQDKRDEDLEVDASMLW